MTPLPLLKEKILSHAFKHAARTVRYVNAELGLPCLLFHRQLYCSHILKHTLCIPTLNVYITEADSLHL